METHPYPWPVFPRHLCCWRRVVVPSHQLSPPQYPATHKASNNSPTVSTTYIVSQLECTGSNHASPKQLQPPSDAQLLPLEHTHRAQSGLIRRDREFSIFGDFSFFMHARIISERDFQTIRLKILIPNRALIRNKNLISYEPFSGDLGPVRLWPKMGWVSQLYNNLLFS